MDGKRSVNLTGAWDTRISRRVLLRTGGSAAAGLLLFGRGAMAAEPPWDQVNPFQLGVASGDPTPDGFVLWTRLLPEGTPLDGSAMKQEPYGVRYEIAADPQFQTIVRRGAQEAVWEESHTVHAEIAGLQPATWYWYRFKWGRAISVVGRTRTAPPAGAAVDKLTFAFVSCQNRVHGYYPAYRDMVDRDDLDLVVHLGDYIYEGTGDGQEVKRRTHEPHAECRSLSDYRTRHAQYKTDPELRGAHAAYPWLPTWDDHEFKNNYADLDLDLNAGEPEEPLETIAARRAAAYLAFWEHQPLHRFRKPVGKDMQLYRRAHWGALATFHVLDTRQYRADQLDGQCALEDRDPVSSYCKAQLDASRQLMGDKQRLWLYEGLAQRPTGSGWNILANQVGFAPQDTNGSASITRFGLDAWDGYAGDRQRLLDFLKAQDLRNLVVITGDKHFSSVRNVAESYLDRTGPVIATEFIGTSVSTGGDGSGDEGSGGQNPHILWQNRRRGYVRVELTDGLWQTHYRLTADNASADAPSFDATSWMVENGRPGADELPV